MRERATERARVSLLSEPLGPATLALLHRVTRTAELLDITPSALLPLLDVLEADPSLRGLGAFGLVEEAIDGGVRRAVIGSANGQNAIARARQGAGTVFEGAFA